MAVPGLLRGPEGGGAKRDRDPSEHVRVPTPAVPRGHWHVGYCYGSCDSGECGVDASGLLAALQAPWKHQNTS